MNFYSDNILTETDIRDACREVGVQCSITPMQRPRTRKAGWTVKLTDWSSNRHRNGGNCGAATWDTPPASYDKHGEVMAILFAKDPEAKLAHWNTLTDFRAASYQAGEHKGELFVYHAKTALPVA